MVGGYSVTSLAKVTAAGVDSWAGLNCDIDIDCADVDWLILGVGGILGKAKGTAEWNTVGGVGNGRGPFGTAI